MHASAMAGEIRLHPSWREPLHAQFDQPYMAELKAFLAAERAGPARIFPRPSEWFAALDLTPLDQVRVVILGQDPYHGEGQAHGLAFSVPPGVRPPPSLINIFKELKADLDIDPPRPMHGCLTHWAKQGVLLLNTSLTVRIGSPGSHAGKGWERFTDAVIGLVNARDEPAVFMLWGRHAQAKASFVDASRHLVLKAPHPSPLSASTGFFGCRHFSQANAFLTAHGIAPIDWRLDGGAGSSAGGPKSPLTIA
jgi:uracil-DNA glycosylase